MARPEKPVSLHPLTYKEAVADLLRVEPPKKDATPKKKRATKRPEKGSLPGQS